MTAQNPTLFLTSLLVAITTLVGCKGDEAPPHYEHQDNVFASEATWYVNQHWASMATNSRGEALAHHSTAVWLHTVEHVDPDAFKQPLRISKWEHNGIDDAIINLDEHLLAAERQGNALIQLVLHSLPGKECHIESPIAEIPADEYGMQLYQEHFIAPLSEKISNYPHLPIAIIIEPNSWTQLALNSDRNSCTGVSNTNSYGYTNGIRHAINVLSQHPNVHIYLDVGSSATLGWDPDLRLAALYAHGIIQGFDGLKQQAMAILDENEVITGGPGYIHDPATNFIEPLPFATGDTSPPGYEKIDGFISNVGGYVPLNEPYLGAPDLPDTINPLRSSTFFDWNPNFDEWHYTQQWLETIRALAPASTAHLGMLIDTSRNGWGQSHKTLQGSATAQNVSQVDTHRLDQREHRWNWCNQASGIGKRPQATPDSKSWIDAYVWAKVPGESDGPSDPWLWVIDPNRASVRTETMCDPNDYSRYAMANPATEALNLGTGAMPGAPWYSLWFEDGFATLIDNAWPPLCEGAGDSCR